MSKSPRMTAERTREMIRTATYLVENGELRAVLDGPFAGPDFSNYSRLPLCERLRLFRAEMERRPPPSWLAGRFKVENPS